MKNFGRDLLQKLKAAPFSGEAAHEIYSPPYRPKFSEEEILAKNPKLAAVNIMLYLKGGKWYFPLIIRTVNEHDRHSGQISLPGGKSEPSDRSFAETAIRETSEEIGIGGSYIRIVRELSPIYIPPSNFYVRPFISFTGKDPEFSLQEHEAVSLIEFPISAFEKLPDVPEMRIFPDSRGTEVPVMEYGGHLIWGATSMILGEFGQLLKNL